MRSFDKWAPLGVTQYCDISHEPKSEGQLPELGDMKIGHEEVKPYQLTVLALFKGGLAARAVRGRRRRHDARGRGLRHA